MPPKFLKWLFKKYDLRFSNITLGDIDVPATWDLSTDASVYTSGSSQQHVDNKPSQTRQHVENKKVTSRCMAAEMSAEEAKQEAPAVMTVAGEEGTLLTNSYHSNQ